MEKKEVKPEGIPLMFNTASRDIIAIIRYLIRIKKLKFRK